MSSDNASSAPTSATTSNRAPASGDPAANVSEAEFLRQQAEKAKAAISTAASEMGAKLGESINIGNWTRQYPWMTLGAVTVAGFFAATLVVPSKEEQALRRLRAIENALRPKETTSPGNGHDKDKDDDGLGSGLGGFITRQALKAIPSVMSAVAMAISGKFNRPPTDQPPASDNVNPPGSTPS